MERLKSEGKYITIITMIPLQKEKIQRLLEELNRACSRRGLGIYLNTAKVTGIPKRKEQLRVQINIDGNIIKQVNKFQYIGSLVPEDGVCDQEIKKLIGLAALAKTASGIMTRNTCNKCRYRYRSQNLIDEMLYSLWSTLLYGTLYI